METMSKFLTSLCITGALVFGLSAPADAQDGGHLTAFNNTPAQMRPDALKVHPTSFYHPFVYPPAGTVVGTLPKDSYQFVWNTHPYYYRDGLFYQADADGSYKIAVPPVGAEVPSLPMAADIVTIDNNPYFQYKGIYYESVIKPGGQFAYKVAGVNGIGNPDAASDPALPFVGDMIDQLPEGSRQVKLNGKTYWVTPGGIYMEEVKKDNRSSYRVVWVAARKKEEVAPVTERKG